MDLETRRKQSANQRYDNDDDDDASYVRRYVAILAAWPRRSPRLLMPAPPIQCHNNNNNKVVNPLDLPDEVILTIFEHLPRARDIAAVRGVCRTWCKLVDRTATIWRSLVFDLPKCPSTASSAESWYRKAADYGNTQAQFLLALLYTYGYRGNNSNKNPHFVMVSHCENEKGMDSSDLMVCE